MKRKYILILLAVFMSACVTIQPNLKQDRPTIKKIDTNKIAKHIYLAINGAALLSSDKDYIKKSENIVSLLLVGLEAAHGNFDKALISKELRTVMRENLVMFNLIKTSFEDDINKLKIDPGEEVKIITEIVRNVDKRLKDSII